jgi:hypothetical protein
MIRLDLSQPARWLTWGFIISGCTLYICARLIQPSLQSHSRQIETGPSPAIIQSIAAGPFKGMASDFNILSVFTMYNHIKSAPLDKAQQQMAWQHLSSYLNRAQSLDPWFRDTYRLTIGLLAFSDGFASDAVQILEAGSAQISWDWKLPFYAGFIAYDRLNDRQKAFELMQESISRPNVSPLAIGLASRFLQKEKGSEASIFFLEYMLQTMPEKYHGPIKNRIKRLRDEAASLEETK